MEMYQQLISRKRTANTREGHNEMQEDSSYYLPVLVRIMLSPGKERFREALS